MNEPRVKKISKRDKILLASEHIKNIASHFTTSKTNVHAALSYYNNSPLAMSIRNQARKILLKEASKIQKNV